jgi:two-component system, NarL family, sensor histidine kinase BarA
LTSLNTGDATVVQEEFELVTAIKEVLKQYGNTLDTKGVKLVTQLPERLRIVSDRVKVDRIVRNLLNNAAKFTTAGQVTVKLRESSDRRAARLEIIDTGIGIERDQVEMMFEAFKQRDDSVRREFSGLGLGLTVARKLADLLGGKLELQSQQGVGTHVTLTLPNELESARSYVLQQTF